MLDHDEEIYSGEQEIPYEALWVRKKNFGEVWRRKKSDISEKEKKTIGDVVLMVFLVLLEIIL